MTSAKKTFKRGITGGAATPAEKQNLNNNLRHGVKKTGDTRKGQMVDLSKVFSDALVVCLAFVKASCQRRPASVPFLWSSVFSVTHMGHEFNT
jgi:hypothetical protein